MMPVYESVCALRMCVVPVPLSPVAFSRRTGYGILTRAMHARQHPAGEPVGT